MMTERLPTFFIPHGGGPCFFMEWTMEPPDTWDRMQAWLEQLSFSVPRRPEAILIISAHWETDLFEVTASRKPPLIYDYYGFPEHTYRLRYDAPGSPAVAQRTRELLGAAGIPSIADRERGLDHGAFIPLKLIYPDADIPVVQLSLKRGLDPALHVAAGRAIAPLRDENVLIIGSGMSYHNMAAYARGEPPTLSGVFDAWLSRTVTDPDPERRNEALARWEDAPSARDAHPREEHLIPLMVAAGAATGDPGQRVYADHVMGATVSAYRFG